MSQHPDPCYCEQAQEYEALLEQVCEAIAGAGLRDPENALLLAAKEIRETLARYQEAQAEL